MIAAAENVTIHTELLQRLADARRETDKLFQLVHPDFLYQRPIPERHRIIFYLGHLEAFDWNLLQPRLPQTKVFYPEFDRLFAFGIDPIDGGLPSDQPSDWPSRQQVEQYCTKIRTTLDAALSATHFSNWAGDESPSTLLNVMIEHRLMHLETLAYMLHQMPYKQRRSVTQTPVVQAAPPIIIATRQIPAGRATLGLTRDPAHFGWDNEYEMNTVDVPAFALDRHKITNGQFLKFVQAGGYQQSSLWSPAAWDWIQKQGITHPLLWTANNHGWNYRAMFEEIALPLAWPVYVSHAEASAYAAWAGKGLPTEAEWHRAAYGTAHATENDFPWGAQPPQAEHGCFDLRRWDPSPVNAFPASASAFGVSGLLGNGWEWTSTLFQPFPRFQPFPFYEGYSANFFDGMHYVMKGGSPRTAHCMLRRSFRNWFQPHYQYVYAGFRCAER